MGKLIGGEVVGSVATKLRAGFTIGEIPNIYKDKLPQGLIVPCIFVHQITGKHQKEMLNRANRDYLLDIRVHPSDSNTTINSWLESIAERLIEYVEEITVSSQTVVARDINWQIIDGVLHFFCKYSFKVVGEASISTTMENLDYSERMR